uniref:Uncharacterized protein n=1 Tax=Meloidogyne javanica TaxID=6303 RepID=A0A915MFH7_MELJA
MAMTSSPDFDNEIENFTPKMVADKLNLGDNFAEWMAKEKFSDDNLLLVLNFVGVEDRKRDDVKKALIANKAVETGFDNVFKFKDMAELIDAKRGVKAMITWAFYNASTLEIVYRGADGKLIPFAAEPTILTALISFFNYEEEGLCVEPSNFFEV